MEKYRAKPAGYMQIGEMAKRVGINISTLRYYDKLGLLIPSSESDGGYRLYNDKDLVTLLQIQTMKQLGFTLSEIRVRLVSLDTPNDMVNVLLDHELSIKKRIASLTKSLKETRALRTEIAQMQSVDFAKYAIILNSLQLNNEYFWAVKYFDGELQAHSTCVFQNKARRIAFTESLSGINAKILRLEALEESPKSKKAQTLVKKYWNLVMEYIDGDISLLPKLIKIANEATAEEKDSMSSISSRFFQSALDIYFAKMGHDPR